MPHKRSKLKARKELRFLYNTAHYDHEIEEIVALFSSGLLDVLRGEVLRSPGGMSVISGANKLFNSHEQLLAS